MAGQQTGDADTRSLWFNGPDDGESRRRALTRGRVVAEALAVVTGFLRYFIICSSNSTNNSALSAPS